MKTKDDGIGKSKDHQDISQSQLFNYSHILNIMIFALILTTA